MDIRGEKCLCCGRFFKIYETKCKERTTYHENKIQQAVQQLEQQFLKFESS